MTGGVIDPGSPFEPGTVRFKARARLLQAVEALLDAGVESPEWPERLAELRHAREVWALYGRDGE